MTRHNDSGAHVGKALIRVRYAETDQMNVVYHSNFIIWFEVGRVELLRQLGYTYKEMEADGLVLPVVEVRCRYKSPARYDDEITVRTIMRNLRGSLIQFGYELVRESDGTMVAEGESTHIVADLQLKRRTLPDKYFVPFKKAMGRTQPE